MKLLRGTHLLDGHANLADQTLEVLGHQLDRREQLGKTVLFGFRLGRAGTVLLDSGLGRLVLLTDLLETDAGQLGVRATFRGGIVVFVFVAFGLFALGNLFDFLDFGDTRHAFVRVDETGEEIGQTSAIFAQSAVVGFQDGVDCPRQECQRRHHLTRALLDPLGDLDFAFAGQGFHGAHLTHVHADGVGGASHIAFHRGEGGNGLFGGRLVSGGIRHHQGIGIGRFFRDLDAHIVDHADDVFHLFGISDILGQVIVDLGIGQVTLFLAARDQLLETRLLLRITSHRTPISTKKNEAPGRDAAQRVSMAPV